MIFDFNRTIPSFFDTLRLTKNNLHTLFVRKTLSAKISRSFTLQKSDDVWLPWNLEHNSINLNQHQFIQKWNFHLLLFRMRNFRNVWRKLSKKKFTIWVKSIFQASQNTSHVRIQREEIRAQWLKKRRRDTFNRDPGGPVAGEHLPISSYTLLFRALELEYRTNSSSFLPSLQATSRFQLFNIIKIYCNIFSFVACIQFFIMFILWSHCQRVPEFHPQFFSPFAVSLRDQHPKNLQLILTLPSPTHRHRRRRQPNSPSIHITIECTTDIYCNIFESLADLLLFFFIHPDHYLNSIDDSFARLQWKKK